jgi:hypothetical protein
MDTHNTHASVNSEWIAAIGPVSATLLATGALVVQQRGRRRVPAEQITGWLELRVAS